VDRELRGGTVGVLATPPRSGTSGDVVDDASADRARPDSQTPAADQVKVPVIGRTRTRVFVLFVLLLGITVLIAAFGIPQLLRLRLERRTEAALDQEIQEVALFLADGLDSFGSLAEAFDTYLDRNVPSIEEGFAAYVDGEQFRARLRSFPGNELPTETDAAWAALTASGGSAGTEPIRGTFPTDLGAASYAALPVSVDGSSGLFVVAILPEAGRREIRDLQTYGAAIMLAVVLAAGLCAWLLTGRVLQPVRELTDVARAITGSGQMQRARVAGSAEAGELATTFNAMLDRLDAADASQLEFVQSAEHELRTPLTVAIGHLELLAEDAASSAEVMPLVLDELARMGRILDDLQSLAMAERPDYVVPGLIAADVLAHELLAKARALAPRSWELTAAASVIFLGDRDRLTEAALNLVDNAVKATHDGDTIAVGVGVSSGEVIIEVSDTGVGIEPGEIDRVVRQFERGTAARRRYRGAGLGLPIVRSIAEAHGGRLEITSRPGAGTNVRIMIPYIPEEGGHDAAADPGR
jgi:two-component system, OmpR family, sensor kinase